MFHCGQTQNQRVWGTEVPLQRGPGAEPRWVWGRTPPEAEDILKITIANIASRDRCINIEFAILAEWIKIVSTVSIFFTVLRFFM